MQDDLEDNKGKYRYLDKEYWCDLLSTIEARYNRKSAATQIKNIESARAAYHSDSNKLVRVPRKKKALGLVSSAIRPTERRPRITVPSATA